MMRPELLWKTRSRTGAMSFSEVVKPGTSALVESVRNRSTPSSPSRANARRSVIRPSSGQLVHLEVTGVQHHPGARADRDRERVRDGVVDRDELQVEGPEADPVALLDDGLDGVLEAVLAQLAAEQGQGQLGPDQRDVLSLAEQERHRADVVLVTVGQHQGVDVVEAVPDGREVRQDQVDPGMVLLGEEHPAVHDEQPTVVLEDGHVAADLAEAAERDHPEAAPGQGRRRGQLGVGMAHSRPASASAARRAPTSSSSRGTRGPRTRRLSSTPSSSRAALAVVAP